MISYDFIMILQWLFNDTMTSDDLLGPPRASKDLLIITMISYDFIMILALLYNDIITSYDILGPHRTSKDLPGPRWN